MNSYRL